MENSTHKTISYFFRCMGVGFIILCWNVKPGAPIKMLKDLSETMAYCLSGMPFFGIGGMITIMTYELIKKN